MVTNLLSPYLKISFYSKEKKVLSSNCRVTVEDALRNVLDRVKVYVGLDDPVVPMAQEAS